MRSLLALGSLACAAQSSKRAGEVPALSGTPFEGTSVRVDYRRLALQLDSLRLRTPEADARQAVQAGHIRLRAMEGGYIPGFADSTQMRAREQYGIDIVPYTSDFVGIPDGDSTMLWWQAAAAEYAKRYNMTVAALVPLRL
jgi:hypothetical protein